MGWRWLGLFLLLLLLLLLAFVESTYQSFRVHTAGKIGGICVAVDFYKPDQSKVVVAINGYGDGGLVLETYKLGDYNTPLNTATLGYTYGAAVSGTVEGPARDFCLFLTELGVIKMKPLDAPSQVKFMYTSTKATGIDVRGSFGMLTSVLSDNRVNLMRFDTLTMQPEEIFIGEDLFKQAIPILTDREELLVFGRRWDNSIDVVLYPQYPRNKNKVAKPYRFLVSSAQADQPINSLLFDRRNRHVYVDLGGSWARTLHADLDGLLRGESFIGVDLSPSSGFSKFAFSGRRQGYIVGEKEITSFELRFRQTRGHLPLEDDTSLYTAYHFYEEAGILFIGKLDPIQSYINPDNGPADSWQNHKESVIFLTVS